MRRGTTPTLKFTIGVPTENIVEMNIAFSQGGAVVLEKKLSDVTVSDGVVSLRLSQADTLKLNQNADVRIQIRILYADGSAIASDPIRCFVEEILKDGEIVGS